MHLDIWGWLCEIVACSLGIFHTGNYLAIIFGHFTQQSPWLHLVVGHWPIKPFPWHLRDGQNGNLSAWQPLIDTLIQFAFCFVCVDVCVCVFLFVSWVTSWLGKACGMEHAACGMQRQVAAMGVGYIWSDFICV